MNKLLLIFVLPLLIQLQPTPAAAEAAPEQRWTFGTELDLFPYLSGGYYFSAVAGRGKWRARYVRVNATTPDFATQSGFDNNEMYVDAYIVDYYFKEGFTGWWVAPGLEKWKGHVTEKISGLRKSYDTDILTLGGGYTFRLSENIYINPWAALHIPIGGDRDIAFTRDSFRLRPIPEASVKLGVNF